MTMITEDTPTGPEISEAELFDQFAKYGIAKFQVEFAAGWDYAEIWKSAFLDENGNELDLQDLLPSDEEVEALEHAAGEFAQNRANLFGHSTGRYDRYRGPYEPGEYYHGTNGEDDYATVTFDTKARRIIAEGDAKVKVFEYRIDHIKTTWEADADYDEGKDEVE